MPVPPLTLSQNAWGYSPCQRKHRRCPHTLVTGSGARLRHPYRLPDGDGGNQLNQAIRLEDRLHHGFPQFHGANLAATQPTLQMSLCREGTTGATAPTRTVQIPSMWPLLSSPFSHVFLPSLLFLKSYAISTI